MATNTARRPLRGHSVDPLLRMETEPPPAFLVRAAQTLAQPTADTPWSWSNTAPVWIALGITAALAVALASGYWLINPEQKQVAQLPKTILAALPAPGTAPTLSARPLAVGLPSTNNQSPPAAIAPPEAASSSAAAPDQSPAVISSTPPITEQVPPAALAAEAPQAAAPHGNDLFVVRFDSKLPGLTPTGLRALDTALRAAHAGRKVRIAIEGCDGGDSAPNGVDCAELTHRLKRILADGGVDHPAELIAGSSRP